MNKRKIVKKSAKLPIKRHIEDVPFYQFQYKFDDLPLDPAKSFLKEKIVHLRQCRPHEENRELDIHVHKEFEDLNIFETNVAIEGLKLPKKLSIFTEKPEFDYSFSENKKSSYPWLNKSERPSEDFVYNVTNQILRLYKERRMKIFVSNARTKSTFYTNEHQRLYGGPSDLIGVNKDRKSSLLKLSSVGCRKLKPIFQPGDPLKHRTLEEIKNELEKMKTVIETLTEPDIAQAKLLKCQQHVAEQPEDYQHHHHKNHNQQQQQKHQQIKLNCVLLKDDKNIYEPRLRKRKFNQEEYMKKLKENEKKKFKYLEGLLPVDPEVQKRKILLKYEMELKQTVPLFTETIRRRTISLMKQLSIQHIETYPSKWIKKVLPQINPQITYLTDAYKFILKEEKLWPNIYPEVMLMDYLFNSDNNIKEDQAILIISSLIDLQEDFKYDIKRNFIRFILKSNIERRRLQLEVEPPSFPILTIKSPVSWKCAKQIATNRLDQVLMVTHPVLQALNTLWHQLYNDILIVNKIKFYEKDVPLNADEITEVIYNSCLTARDILINDWLPRCADLVDVMRKTWFNLITSNPTYMGRAEIMFRCIHALMSYQLQGLIIRSVEHLYKALEVYEEGNLINEYDENHPKLKRKPFMSLIVAVVGKHSYEFGNNEDSNSLIYKVDENDPNLKSNPLIKDPLREANEMKETTQFLLENTGKMFIYPYMEELPKLFISYFVNILKVGYNIPRLEYVMSQREDQYGFLHCIPEDHIDIIKLYEKIQNIVEQNWTGPTTYLYPIYKYYFPLLSGKMMKIAENIFTQNELPDFIAFEELVERLNELMEATYFLKKFIPLNLFMLDNRHVNNSLAVMIREIIEFITNYFRILNLNENRRICDEFEEMSMKAGERPEETVEVVNLQNYLQECRDERIFKLKDEIKIVARRVLFLLHYATLDAEDIHLNSRTFLWPTELEQVLELSAARLNVVRDNLEVALKEKRTKFEEYIFNEKHRMDNFRLKESREVLSLDELKEKVDMVNELMDILEKCSKEAKDINNEEQLLQIDQSFFPVLTELIDKMEPIEKLWKTCYEFEYNHKNWLYGPFTGLNSDAIREAVESMSKIIMKLIRQFAGNPMAKRMAEQFRLKIDKFKIYLPVLDAICRQGLCERHWNQISEKLGKPCNPSIYPSLQDMIDADIMSILPQLEEISNAAGKEFELNAQLVTMQQEWENVMFEILPYHDSDTFILASIDDIQTILDDHILKSQAMRGSPFITALGSKADDWEDKLLSMQDTLDYWLQLQATWMYLEPIFSSEDIMRQMPTEGRNFKSVDKTWRKIMKATNKNRIVIKATDYPNLFEIFQKAIRDLEAVQKGLNTYLEQKRLFFARFFFLSNDELLEILSETKDPLRVQPHLKKCFEGIHSLAFDSNLEITAMISAEKEIVPFVRKIVPKEANGLVEIWLKEVEFVMLDSVRDQLKKSWDNYFQNERKSWVTSWPGQIVQTISCMAWTTEVEEAITKNNMNSYLNKCNQQISDLVSLVRTNLSSGSRITIEALIVLDVHARDVLKSLIENKVNDIGEFDWMAQLRYYWKQDTGKSKPDFICVSMVVTDVRYGLEYLGNITRLVVTPLTDRCYRTIMGALKLCLGGAPEGPAGTGKTETCKDLAKAVAKKCVVFNCSDGLDYKALGKFFKGLAQSGSWACFDEFNRIELEVLSVVAQQILTIQRAIARHTIKFMFEDTMLKLDPTCAIFITMNPGYAGRTELPDNLKVLFRTVAMMVPDYAMIGEITLYSNGFDNARPLAQKIVHTYKLCSEQLSSQSHYDYGMRAVKSVLLASSSLRRMNPKLPEAQIVLRAIIDVNLPKFLEQDVSLFIGIYKDLFPGVDVPEPGRHNVLKWLHKNLENENLQPTDWFVEKVLQIYEMLLVRHGLMIVGGPMSGKTTSYQILAKTLKAVSQDEASTTVEYPVNYRIINPKSITMGQLYGSFDPVSHEWTDGVLAKTFREMVYNGETERNWIVFDGPVDAIWIENLNTVLDDSKKLCLVSGEIIQMTKTMNMIFETADLDQASPATVSRCGMIYMEPYKLGWYTIHKSFLNILTKYGLNEIYMALYEELVEWLIPAAIEIVSSCKTMLEISSIYQYHILSTFFVHFLEQQKQFNQVWFQQTFLFCFVWAYGSALTSEGRKQFDSLIRKVLYGSNDDYPRPRHFSLNRGQIFPEKMQLLDYRFDEIENYWPWLKSEEAQLLQFDDTNGVVLGSGGQYSIEISEIIVPTKETCYIKYWLNLCLNKAIPMLIIGPTGTGKSAIIFNHLKELPKQSNIINIINFSARTTAQQIQETIMSKLDRRRKGVFGPPVGKKCIIFCDDIAMPSKDTYGSQPPLELLRQWLDHGYWTDLKDTSKLELIDLLFVAAMGQMGGSNYIFSRLYRHMFVVSVDTFEENTLTKIFTAIGDWHFSKDYPEKVAILSRGLAEAMVNVYKECKKIFLPTPAKSHYTFSLRDVSRVLQGIVLVPPKRLTEPEKLGRLWAHETYRVFYDRLIEQKDREQLLNIVKISCKNHLRFTLEQSMAEKIKSSSTSGRSLTDDDLKNLFFGNYMAPDAEPKIYDEIESFNKLEKVMKYYLKDYNEFSHSPMDLVMFKFAIEHISRVSRVLQMPRGNILMVGMGGSGRRSSAKLAAYISDAELMTVQITKTYSTNEWHDDIKKILMKSGIGNKSVVFLFSDIQALNESFIEDINTILNTGDLPNLFQNDEKAVILENMQNISKQLDKKIDPSPLSMYGFFIERVREKLHIALAFSPIGDTFKERLRMYPSLVNCCTIDWFTIWPKDALTKVAETFIHNMKLNFNETKEDEEEETKSTTEIPVTGKTESERTIKEFSELELSLIDMVIYFNDSILEASERCYRELSRKNYVTPASYLELLKSFKTFYNRKHNEITQLRDRYITGLEKLDNAASQVGEMQKNLYELQPQLKILSEETEKIMVNIERETAEAEKKKEVVGADEAAANEAAAAAQAIKDDCESDLQEAIPALEAALDALNTLKPADITVVKSMKNPPSGVKLVLEAVCVLKGIKPDRKPDPSGKIVDEYWGPSLRMLGDLKFLESLKTFDKDNIPPAVMKRIREKYISDRDFVPEKIKTVSTACEGLCKWVRAMDVYDRVARIVAPKKLALADAEAELAQQMEKLNAKRAELQEILDKLQKLNDYFAEKSREKKRLEDEIDNCEKKLNRAEKLLGGLGGEKTRWSETANQLHLSLHNVIGDVLLASGSIAYLGFFTTEYRVNILSDWNKRCLQKGIPCSENFLLQTTLGNPMEIRAWSLAGLPSDNFSIENGIITTNALRYPLMIDPQVQANNWIKNIEKNNDLKIIKQTDADYMRVIELSIKYGYPVLLENVGEKLDSNLFPVLERNIFKYKGGYVIKLGDALIEYNHNFRFYITTCLRNPHYPPEIVVMVTILNFMITEQGLREQLLSTTVAHERPDLQEKKEQLIVESSKNRDALYNIETKILQVLSSSEGNILEDENAITILSSSKTLSEEIQEKQKIAISTEIEIDAARQQYIPVAKHSAILFFCITELANIDPMYQYSLSWYLNLFIGAIFKTPKSDELDKRLILLNDYFTRSIYQNVCRSLFEKDKLVISFVMCIGIMLSKGEINRTHLIFLIMGRIKLDNPYPNPASVWLSDKCWSEIVAATDLEGFEKFHENFSTSINKWKKIYDSSEPELLPFPSPYENVDQVSRLILLKCVRPDKLVSAIRNFIKDNMDAFFIEPPPFDLHASFLDSSPKTPLVFLLSPGADPMANLFMYARKQDMYDRSRSISLGQGQGPRAEEMILDGIENGYWVILQNCHLAESWMDQLERICMDTTLTEKSHPDYRLWCTSYPSKVFPVSVLQNSVKMTNESPKGLKLNMLRSFDSDPLVRDNFFSNAFSQSPEQYKARTSWLRGVFALVFFHAVVQERKEFGPLGWNIPYDFNESDLKISLMQLKMFIRQYGTIPFKGHTYLTGECNYGGRVTDDKDRRLVISLLKMIYNQDCIDVDNYPLSASGKYRIPIQPTRTNSIEYILTFPLNPHPEVFGLHENADINRNNRETEILLSGVLLTQTQLLASTKAETSTDATIDPAFNLCTDILERLPNNFDVDEIEKKYPTEYTNSMNTVLRQEVIRFNRLLNYIRNSLQNVQKALQGQIAMIPELNRIHKAITVGKLPEDWLKISYPSLKSLGSYINDFLSRLEFLQNWIDNGEPNVYWLSGFYFTQSFITGVLQNFSRKRLYQIDLIGIKFEITDFEMETRDQPDVGVYIRGLFLEGARWNRDQHHLDESKPKILFDPLPIVKMIPFLKNDLSESNETLYDCPIYKTSERRGVLSTTGHSTNFVMYMQLKTKLKPSHWINRGTACLCQLND